QLLCGLAGLALGGFLLLGLLGLLGRSLALRGRPGRLLAALAFALGRLDAGAQGRHEVDGGAALLLGLGGRDDLLARDLGLDDLLERLAVAVVVLRRVEVGLHGGDQRLG